MGQGGTEDVEMLNNVTEFREATDGRARIQYLTPESGHHPLTTLLPELIHTWWALGGLHSLGQLLLSYTPLPITSSPSSAHQCDSGSCSSCEKR